MVQLERSVRCQGACSESGVVEQYRQVVSERNHKLSIDQVHPGWTNSEQIVDEVVSRPWPTALWEARRYTFTLEDTSLGIGRVSDCQRGFGVLWAGDDGRAVVDINEVKSKIFDPCDRAQFAQTDDRRPFLLDRVESNLSPELAVFTEMP